MKKHFALVAAAFVAFAVLDARAAANSDWDRCFGVVIGKFKDKKARRNARRAVKREPIRQGFVHIGTVDTSVSSETFSLTSPAAPNEANNAAVSNVNIPDAQSASLSPEQMSMIAGVEGTLANLFGGGLSSKAPKFTFTTIDITSIKVKGAYRTVSNFTRLVGSETYTISGVIVGGADDGLEVSGTLKVKIAGRRQAL